MKNQEQPVRLALVVKPFNVMRVPLLTSIEKNMIEDSSPALFRIRTVIRGRMLLTAGKRA